MQEAAPPEAKPAAQYPQSSLVLPTEYKISVPCGIARRSSRQRCYARESSRELRQAGFQHTPRRTIRREKPPVAADDGIQAHAAYRSAGDVQRLHEYL